MLNEVKSRLLSGKKRIITIIILLFTIFISNVECYAKRYALVIGNGSYKNVPLRNPVNDANDIANILQELDFDVSKKTNASRQEIINAIRNFENKITSADVALFYYSGHGLQVNGINYIIPIGADINTENEVEFEAVAMNRIMSKLEKARINIIILDACRDNPYKGFRSAEKGLAILTSKTEGTFIAYSTAPGKVAIDGTGRNSPYTKNLIEKINIPDLKIEETFKEVRKAVKNETNNKQIPWDSSYLTDDFIFAKNSKSIESGTEIESKTLPKMDTFKEKVYDKKPNFIKALAKRIMIGIKIGKNFGSTNIKYDKEYFSEFTKYQLNYEMSDNFFESFFGGIFITYIFNEIFAIQSEIVYSANGIIIRLCEECDSLGYYYDSEYNCLLQYLNIPLLVKISLHDRKISKFNILLGSYFGISIEDCSGEGGSYGWSQPLEFDGISDLNNDLGLMIGFSLVFKNYFVESRYNLGLHNLSKHGKETINNRWFSIGLGYNF